MSAVNPNGSEEFWIDGHSYDGLRNGYNQTGSEEFWMNGKSADFIIPFTTDGNFLIMF